MARKAMLIAVGVLTVALLLTVALPSSFAYTAIRVYGQADFSGNAINRGGPASAETMNTPIGIALSPDGGMYVADRDNHRVLYFANDGDAVADRVYGQYGSFTSHISNNDGTGNSGKPSPDNLAMPVAVAVDSQGGLYVADRDNSRVLYFANDGDTTADRVYGQSGNYTTNMILNDGNGNFSSPSANNLSAYILGLAVDQNDGLFVSDSANHRVLYFANDGDTTADRVYGQFDAFTVGVRNNDGAGHAGRISERSLNFPRGLAVDANNGLYVADRDNNRILYFADDGDTAADRVYGQYGSFSTNVASNDGQGNKGTPTADNLSQPKDIAIGPAGGLYVSDTLHHRVLWFANDGDTTADGVGGQFQNMTTAVANNDGAGNSGTPSEMNLNGPQGIEIGPDGLIYVSDTSNNRVLVIECPAWPG